nr:MAG TPA: hypothetical protein [Caudoviricetes sp.]
MYIFIYVRIHITPYFFILHFNNNNIILLDFFH